MKIESFSKNGYKAIVRKNSIAKNMIKMIIYPKSRDQFSP